MADASPPGCSPSTPARGDLLVARLERKGRNGSHQGDNRRRGFMDYLREAGRAGVVREVVLRPGDAAHNDAVLDEALARYPDVSGAVLFNSTCYLLGEYLQRRGCATYAWWATTSSPATPPCCTRAWSPRSSASVPRRKATRP